MSEQDSGATSRSEYADKNPKMLGAGTVLLDFSCMIQPNIARILTAHQAYIRLGTLDAAGQEMGITRERVRQLIMKGVKLKLFANPINVAVPVQLTVSDFIDGVAKHGSVLALALQLNYTENRLSQWQRIKGVSPEDLKAAVLRFKRQQCIDDYMSIVNEINHHPTTTELEFKVIGGRALYARIVRNWPSFAAFRRELGIAQPRPGNPNIRRDTAAAHEARSLMARVKRSESQKAVERHLQDSGPSTRRELHVIARVGSTTLDNILRGLEKLGKIEKQRDGMRYVYSLCEEK